MSYAFDEITISEEPGGTVVALTFKDKLKSVDYDHFVPMVEKIMASRKKIRMLIKLEDFKGWSAGAFWEDTKFGLRHYNDVDLLAVVGDKEWEKTMTRFLKPFTRAKVRYFDMTELDLAWDWISKK